MEGSWRVLGRLLAYLHMRNGELPVNATSLTKPRSGQSLEASGNFRIYSVKSQSSYFAFISASYHIGRITHCCRAQQKKRQKRPLGNPSEARFETAFDRGKGPLPSFVSTLSAFVELQARIF